MTYRVHPHEPDPAPVREERWLVGLCLLLALLVACARLYQLGAWSYWYDEAMTVTDAGHGVEGGELHNPLGYRALRVIAGLFGSEQEWAWRLLPAVAGALLVPVAYLALRGLAEPLVAAAGALVLAASSWALYWSQNARFYTLAALLSLAGAGLAWRGLRHERAGLGLAGLALMALASGMHLSAALALVGLVGALLVLCALPGFLEPLLRKRLVWLFGGLLLCCLLGLPWGLKAWRTYLVSKEVPPGLGAKLASFAHFFASFGFFLTPALGVAASIGGWCALRARRSGGWLALWLVAIGILSAAAASLFGRVTAQYAFCLLPWLTWLACLPLERMTGTSARVAWIALLVLPALVDQALYFGLRHGDRPRWREALAYVWQEREPDDLVAAMAAPIAECYLSGSEGDLRRPRTVAWLTKWRPAIPQAWIDRGRRVWIVICPENLEDFARADREALERFLREDCHRMRELPVPAVGREPGVLVFLYEG